MHTKPVFDEPVWTLFAGVMPFFEPEQPFYTYSIDIATLWGGAVVYSFRDTT